jgi:hypothetical protein
LEWSVERGEAVHVAENLYKKAEKSRKKKEIISGMISEGD